MTAAYVHSVALMGTVVTFHVVGDGPSARRADPRETAVTRAVDWFNEVERACSRFDTESEVRRLSMRVGEPVPVSPVVFEAVQFALALAGETDGAFDPTIGAVLHGAGFDRHYRTGESAPLDAAVAESTPTFRDVHLDPRESTILLDRPTLLDLGAVAKGMAIDLAARELAAFENFAIDAGGDLYFAGMNGEGRPWTVGIRHPRDAGSLIETLSVSNAAVCTSGDYERRSETTGWSHILDSREGQPATTAVSTTVIASSAMVADALGTAAFALGPAAGIRLLEGHGVAGFMLDADLVRFQTTGMQREFIRAAVNTRRP